MKMCSCGRPTTAGRTGNGQHDYARCLVCDSKRVMASMPIYHPGPHATCRRCGRWKRIQRAGYCRPCVTALVAAGELVELPCGRPRKDAA